MQVMGQFVAGLQINRGARREVLFSQVTNQTKPNHLPHTNNSTILEISLFSKYYGGLECQIMAMQIIRADTVLGATFASRCENTLICRCKVV